MMAEKMAAILPNTFKNLHIVVSFPLPPAADEA